MQPPQNGSAANTPLLGKPGNSKKNIARRYKAWRKYLHADIDPAHATGPLAAFCFMTGFIDAISFTAAFVWCGFQTGNFAQLALAVGRILSTPNERGLHPADILALTSLLSFNVGAFAGGRIGDRIGPHTRAWLSGGTLIQAILTLIAAACIYASGEESISTGRGVPAWNSALSSIAMGLMAASLGIQGVIGKRITSNFSTTVVLTALWIEFVSDPKFLKSPMKRMVNRDNRIMALFVLFAGAVLARVALLYVEAVGALLFAAVLRVAIASWWLTVKGKFDDRETDDEVSENEQEEQRYGAVA
ncbi:hypothetical protein MIND_01217400 [Mycena indigotica]|uniref:DUF1275 domain protein n=1 Tax=Mycena indigotica TaxID=2126181 RepID=A0A8H6S2A8_9AGAR|nr:uncharacterized protein MIND_01217400 [Mycena indigotica]KAF7291920.1 hypothetical protein MIND_01217400 [Mycena indigotica]